VDLGLREKVIVVTGGESGIGAAICSALRLEGAVSASVDRAGEGDLVLADLTDIEAIARAVEEIRSRYGRVYGLVNNAGANDGVGLRDGDAERFVASLRENLVHYYEMARLLLPDLVASRGAIVNITSKVAETGQGGTSGYAAANGGRNALTREWAAELAKDGVRVNGVVVAECMTPMYRRWLDSMRDPAAEQAKIESRIPLGRRMTTPEEIAATALFLLSERSSHTTGELVHVDGGYVRLDRRL
jgi:L-fucose dehydrogenase